MNGIPSLTFNLMIAIELEFGIEFDQSEIQNFANVGELMASIEKKLAAKDKSISRIF